MTYTGLVYRPPFEAQSPLLEVTVGCSHNACTFCTMYREVRFQTVPMEQIERDLKEIRARYRQVKRIFLVNGDPFALSAERLNVIGRKINEMFPELETIAAYASIKNIRAKTDEELRKLYALKFNELNIGVESGVEEVLQHFNKGFTAEEAKLQFHRLAHGIKRFAFLAAGEEFELGEHSATSNRLKYKQIGGKYGII